MNPPAIEKDIDQIILTPGPIEAALHEAFRDAVRKHRQAGVPMVFWRDGKVVHVPADQLPDPDTMDKPK